MTYKYTEQDYEHVVRMLESHEFNMCLSIRKIIAHVMASRDWLCDEEMAAARTKHIRKMIRQEEEYQDRKRI